MGRFLSYSLALFTFLCVVLATERRAWAYVDPGSGLLALQSAASMMAALGYLFRRRLRSLFAKKAVAEKAIPPMAAEKTTTGRAA
jgi:hypothetical protein